MLSKVKSKEIAKLAMDEINAKLVDLKTELVKIKAQASVGGSAVESPGRIRSIRRAIARIETIKSNKKFTGGKR